MTVSSSSLIPHPSFLNLVELIIKIAAFAPLVTFVAIMAGYKWMSKTLTAVVACGSVFVSFVCSAIVFYDQVVNPQQTVVTVYEWISSGTFQSGFSFLIDRLSATFMLFITGVAFLIHVFSVSYMWEDDGFRRFFSYLNMFTFLMLVLIMADSLLITFIGWEGVGFASFMLISFWHQDMKNNDAAKKAFVMNRIGDFGYLMAMCLLFVHLGSLSYSQLFYGEKLTAMQALPVGTLSLIAGCLFLGSVGKSAQIPLFTWLPDAMAAPTPVSALIHAATMVTAGVYLVARTSSLFEMTPDISMLVAIIGTSTAILGAAIGLLQTDIKKVLAYSTVSQLGLMFMALGLGAYSAAIFHVVTHAFFKALLFLGSGSVIHAMSGEQDIRKMGGLRNALPITYKTFLIGTLAISGIPPLAGFFSKDQILASALETAPIFFVLGLGVSLMTAFYMFRLLFLTFFGEFRGTAEQKHHLHESPALMTVPLIILAIMSIVGGWIGIPHGIAHAVGIHKSFDSFMEPVLGKMELQAGIGTELLVIGITTLLILGSIYYAYLLFVKRQLRPVKDTEELTGFSSVIAGKFFIDEIYRKYIVQANDKFAGLLEQSIERFVDSTVNAAGTVVSSVSGQLRKVQTGQLEHYVVGFVLAVIVMIGVLIF
jgi:NADH-quinone oxidoreductase subunit L